ncbi:hypothetical protein H8A95_21970 [Bradyrhizobium sp. Pear76]|uniref:hypothetical protein n=1 Tax=Bradyrhizobium oropedii TaxID=1571201 RepID=UPI001E3127A1|nr:hypothetical protein [Bradyrhizobium oropedii]MCC8964906.1 hypothetical protein [Bradyrhizobium oropedii]
MAGPVDAFLKVSLAVAALFASASVGYYYLAYLPQKDAQASRLEAQRDLARKMDAARIESARLAEQAAAAAEKRDLEERQTAAREAVQVRYRSCVRNAEARYADMWTAACREIADNNEKSYRDCMKQPNNTFCATLFSDRSNTSNCSLPRLRGTDISDTLDKARTRCLDESRAGLQ